MIISDIISLDRTQCSVECYSKKRIFEVITEIALKQNPRLNQDEVLSSLINREKLGSTGIGNGIAIPHGRIKGLEHIMAVIVTSDEPIEFDAIDGKPVDIFFAILVPNDEADTHLKALAGIARKLSDKEIVKAIRSAENKKEIVAALA
ncbi:PTS IIA-like nitrogen regulatory protein PtsN [Glaciecola sp. XM2]|jgi:PTS system nitrogen regulatory IIA component|uniref:PTS IIA-like nitrogen regulatory protein PtsN n=1 Tax=Glaciecola sp. XM2 TaxID=1914931 RepID=UPI001BDE8F99|nr:PTS IIA-like nitrogen regulatory protein PtsN [Glaciecola sp. XM2]MBT1452488.1 PTS IIA-like nitrogen regulatory protein PtsN [Glaciecola sp. XM2]